LFSGASTSSLPRAGGSSESTANVKENRTDATFAEAVARFGEQGIVELGTIVGYYTAVGNPLNAFQVPLPAGAPQPFPE
jgi:hypothetical protein